MVNHVWGAKRTEIRKQEDTRAEACRIAGDGALKPTQCADTDKKLETENFSGRVSSKESLFWDLNTCLYGVFVLFSPWTPGFPAISDAHPSPIIDVFSPHVRLLSPLSDYCSRRFFESTSRTHAAYSRERVTSSRRAA